MHAIAFYVFAAVIVASGTLVITLKNPVHSVLFLILAFLNASALFLLLGAEFLALILAIVYVGAVTVLFLFVVMMLDVDFEALRKGAIRYGPIGLILGGILVVELALVIGTLVAAPETAAQGLLPQPAGIGNTEALGRILYTNYIYAFQAAGMILLVAMVGAIVLTLRTREGVKRQSVTAQMARRPADAVELKDVAPGQGI